MIRFKQRIGKMSFKALVELETMPISNLLLFSDRNSRNAKLEDIINRYTFSYAYSKFPGMTYGKPNLLTRGLENNPGVWIFDFENGVTILMFSDGFKKNHYKGSWYDLVIKDDLDKDDVADALESLLDDFDSRFKSQFPDDYKEYKEIYEKFNQHKSKGE